MERMLRNRDGIACKLQFAFVEWLRHERRVADEQQMAVATNRRRRRIDNTESSDAGATPATEGAGRSRTAAITLAVLAPSNARFPVSISYSTQPKEKISARASVTLPCNCSGAM